MTRFVWTCLGIAALAGCAHPPSPPTLPASTLSAINRSASRAACFEAQAALKAGKERDAEAALVRAAALDPTDPEPHTEQARLYWKHHQFREAALAFDEALRLDPNNVLIILALIQTRIDSGDDTRTEELARRAVSLEPRNPKALVYLGRHLATHSSRPRDLQEARECLQQAADIAPDMPIPLTELGTLLRKEKEYGRAQPLLARSWRLLHAGPRSLEQMETVNVLESYRLQTAYQLMFCARAQKDATALQTWSDRVNALAARRHVRARLLTKIARGLPKLDDLIALADLDRRIGADAEARFLAGEALRFYPTNPRAKAFSQQAEHR